MNRPPRALPVSLIVLLLGATVAVLFRSRGQWIDHAEQLAAELQRRVSEQELRADELSRGPPATERGEPALAEPEDDAQALAYQTSIWAAELALRGNELPAFQHFMRSAPAPERDFEWRYLARLREQMLVTFAQDEWLISALALSGAGDRLVSADAEGGLQLWDVPGQVLLHRWPGDGDAVMALAVHPSGEFVAAGGEGAAIRVYSLRDREAEAVRLVGHEEWVTALAFAAAPDVLVSSSEDGTIRVWDFQQGRERFTLRGHEDQVLCVATCAATHQAASASVRGRILLWDLDRGELLQDIAAQEDWISCVDLDPQGLRVVSGADDATVRVHELASGALVWEQVLEDEVAAVRFAPQGGLVLAATARGAMLELEGTQRARLRPPLLPGESVRLLDIAGDLMTIAYDTSEERLHVWRRGPRNASSAFEPGEGPLRDLAVSADGRRLAACSETSVHVVELDTGEALASYPGEALSVALSADGALLLCGRHDGSLDLRRVGDDAAAETFPALDQPVQCVQFSADESALVAATRTGAFQVVRRSDGKVLLSKPAPQPGAFAVRCDSAGRTVFWAGDGGTVRVWDTRDGAKRAGLRDPLLGMISDLALTPDERQVLTLSFSTFACLFDLDTGTQRLRVDAEDGDRFERVAISPSGRRVAFGTYRGRVHLHRLPGGQRLMTFEVGPDLVHDVLFTAQGGRLVASAGGRVVWWDTAEPEDEEQ